MTMGFEEADPIRELHGHMDQTLRVAMASALQVAYVRAERARQHGAQVTLDTGEEERARGRRRQVDRAVAESLWRRAGVPAWWDEASPEQVARVYEAALSHAHLEPDAADALVRIDAELASRYGLAVDPGSGLVRATADPELDAPAVHAAMPAAEASARDSDERLARWQAAVGADLAEPMVRSPAWPALETRLTELEAQGVDSAKALADALGSRDMGGAKDVARVLNFRLSDPAQKAKDKGLGTEREGLDRARLVNDTIAWSRLTRPVGPDSGRGAPGDTERIPKRQGSRDRDAGPER